MGDRCADATTTVHDHGLLGPVQLKREASEPLLGR
jgi:hypothetical protein